MLSEEYRQQLRQMHEPDEDGRVWGATACRHVYEIVDTYNHSLKAYAEDDDIEPEDYEMLDYGSSDGKLAFQIERRNLLPYTTIFEYDPGVRGREYDNIPCHFVVCFDVLEHIEPDYLEAVLEDLKRCTRHRGLFQISLQPAKQILPDGRNAHLIVESAEWWTDQVSKYFNIVWATHNRELKYLKLYVEKVYED